MRIFTEISIISRKIRDDNVSAFAAQSTLFIILSFFPFLMLLMTLVQYTPLSEEMLLHFVDSFVPINFRQILESLIGELYSAESVGFIVISIISVLWSAGKGFVSLIDGLNSVFEIKERRNWVIIRLYAILYTVVFIVLIILCAVVFLLGSQLLSLITRYAPVIANLIEKIIQLRGLISIVLFTLFFTFLYVAIPHKHTKILHQLPGALFSALGWTLFSYGFAYYITISNRISLIYGSLSSAIMIILWLYICMYIFLIGAEINMYVEQIIIRRQIDKSKDTTQNTHL